MSSRARLGVATVLEASYNRPLLVSAWVSVLWGERDEEWVREREEEACPSFNLVRRKTAELRRTSLAKPAYHRRTPHKRRCSGAFRLTGTAYSESRTARKWNTQDRGDRDNHPGSLSPLSKNVCQNS